MQQLHPVTDTLLSHLSLSAPPQPAHTPHPPEKHWQPRLWLQTAGPFVATNGVKRALVPSGQAQFDSYPSPRMWSDTSDGSWLGSSHGKPAAAASRSRLRARGNICPHNRRWSRASQTYSCHRTPVSLSWAIILFLSLVFISCPSSLQLNGKLLGRGYPVIFSPSTEWAPKGVLGKLATWPSDYTLSMRDDLVLKRGGRAGVWLRSKKCSLSPFFVIVGRPRLCSHHSYEWFSFCDTDTTHWLSSNSLCFTDAL